MVHFSRYMNVRGRYIEQRYTKMIELQRTEEEFQPGAKERSVLTERRILSSQD